MKPDDASLTTEEYRRIQQEARKALLAASAFGRFPTPVTDIMAAVELADAPDDLSDEGLLVRLRRKAEGALKMAVSKIVGLFHASSRLVFIDQSLALVKRTFVRLHETAHGWLPWQRDMYAVVEDCEKSLAPEVADLFDREANVFAAEVLFQMDGFIKEARDHAFGIGVPLKVGKKYGASAYASIREYVRKNPKACAVLVLNPPVLAGNDGFVTTLRRVEVSSSFAASIGMIDWPERFTPDDSIGAIVPIGGRKMSPKRQLALTDARGTSHECVAEAFTQGFQVFILILVTGECTRTVFV